MKNDLESFKNLVESFNALPAIGEKSALKLAYYIVTEGNYEGIKLAHAIEKAIESIKKCKRCNNLSEDELCTICSDDSRDKSKICIVESAKDILIIEKARYYNGLYYVLDNKDSFEIEHLKTALKGVKEVIFAFTPSIASDTLIIYLENILSDLNLKFTKIAQGVPTGISLENVDVLSLVKAIEDRISI